MNEQTEISKRADEMLANPYELPMILEEISRRPGWLPILSMVLSDARTVYRALDAIMQAAAVEAARGEIERKKWLDQEVA